MQYRLLVLDQALPEVGEHGFGGHARRMDAATDAVAHEIEQGRSRARLVFLHAVHFEIAAVDHDDPEIPVESAQAVRHVLQRRVEELVSLAERFLVPNADGDVLMLGDLSLVGACFLALH